MIPLRDDLSGGGPPPGTLLLVIAVFASGLASGGPGFWAGLVCAIGMFLFAPSVVRSKGTLAAIAIAILGGAVGLGITYLLGGTQWTWVAPGATAAIVITHLLIHRHARILGLILLPGASRVVSAPAGAVAALFGIVAAALAGVSA